MFTDSAQNTYVAIVTAEKIKIIMFQNGSKKLRPGGQSSKIYLQR